MSFVLVDVESEQRFYWILFNAKGEILDQGSVQDKNKLAQTKVRAIFLGLPREMFFAQKVELPPLSYENIKEALSYRVPKLFYFIQKPFFLFFPLKPDFSLVMVLVTEQEKLNQLISNLENFFGAKVVAGFLSSMALASFLVQKERSFSLTYNRLNGKEFLVFKDNVLKEFYFIANQDQLPTVTQSPHFSFAWENQKNSIAFDQDVLLHVYRSLKKSAHNDYFLKNLYPERIKYLKEESLLHKVAIGTLIFSFFLASASPLINLIKQVNWLEQKTKRLKTTVKRIKAKETELEQKYAQAKTILSYFQTKKLDILYQTAKLLPPEVEITYIYLDKNVIRYRGYAPKATDVLNSLSKCKELTDLKFTGPILKTKRNGQEVETFNLEAKIEAK